MNAREQAKALVAELRGRLSTTVADVQRTRHRKRLIARLGELTYWEHMGEPSIDSGIEDLVSQIAQLTPAAEDPPGKVTADDEIDLRSPAGKGSQTRVD